MYPPNQDKIVFMIGELISFNKFMPLGLKIYGATYQRLMNKAFKEFNSNIMEVYVNDMTVKSTNVEDHSTHLERGFNKVRKHSMYPNTGKSEKFLGFMITQRWIEVNLSKCQATLTMRSPSNLKKV